MLSKFHGDSLSSLNFYQTRTIHANFGNSSGSGSPETRADSDDLLIMQNTSDKIKKKNLIKWKTTHKLPGVYLRINAQKKNSSDLARDLATPSALDGQFGSLLLDVAIVLENHG